MSPSAPAPRLVLGAATVPTDLAAVLRRWLPTQRWFPRRAIGLDGATWDNAVRADLPASAPAGAAVQWWALNAAGTWISVPLVCEAAAPQVVRLHVVTPAGAECETGLIGHVESPAGQLAVYDAPHHPAFAAAAAALAMPEGGPVRASHVLSGEQSNTSLVVSAERDHVMKVLRVLSEGPDLDVEIPLALRRHGFDAVPDVTGVLESEVDEGNALVGWPATLAVFSALVADADDGFTLACAWANEGTSADVEAARIGAVVARLHAALRAAYPVRTLTSEDVVACLRQRCQTSASQLDEAAELMGPIDSYLDRVAQELGAQSPDLAIQRFHRDLHLGQLLANRDGWWVLDFEGEPLRPVAERIGLQVAALDVAGLSRSFQYAGAMAGAPDQWAEGAREALLTSYLTTAKELYRTGSLGGPPVPPTSALALEVLVEAFELDKALYEVRYERQHRPTWAHIPLRAVERILEPVR